MFGGDWSRFRAELRQVQYDHVIDAQGLVKSAWLAYQARGPLAGPDRASAREPLTTDPQLVASMLQGMLAGVSRRILESPNPDKTLEPIRRELTVAACAYLEACFAPPPLHETSSPRNVARA